MNLTDFFHITEHYFKLLQRRRSKGKISKSKYKAYTDKLEEWYNHMRELNVRY